MPVYSIETPSGKVLDIEAATEGDAIRGAQEWQSQNAPKSDQSSALSNLLKPITDIPGEIYGAAKSAASVIGENLNPFSQSRMDSIERQSKAPSMLDALKENVSQIGGVGSGLASVLALAASPVTGATRSLIGHPYSALTGIPYEQAKDAVDTAMMGVAPRAASPTAVRTVAPKAPTADEIRTAATTGFETARNSGVTVPASDINNLAKGIKADLYNKGLRPSVAKQTNELLDELATSPKGAFADVADLHAMRQALGHMASQPGPEKAAASIAMKKLDSYISNVSPELKDAIGNYAAVKRADTISGRMDRAMDQAGSANSGQNIENAIRQQLRGILSSDKLKRGYTETELEAMRKIVRGASIANVTRGMGNLMGGGGGLGMYLSGAVGGVLAGPIGLAAPAVGWAAKRAGGAMTQSKVDALESMIRSRSPLAQSIPATQAPMPSPLLGSILPYQIPNAAALPMGLIPARADEKKKNR